MTDQQVKSYHTKGNVEKLRPVHKGTALSKQTNKKDKQEQNALDKDVPFVQPPQKLGSCAYLHYYDFAYITVDAHMCIRREIVRLHHNHYHYHPLPKSEEDGAGGGGNGTKST